jgi:hypothetical protein
VRGLPGKDVIDIQVTVASLDRDRLAPASRHRGSRNRAGPPPPSWRDRSG